ncbi:hypothetical protein BDW02DRAFT_594235 [Decorospora gaudefroyi]|uniref:Uncharacterized protein n=1 Tax=Decorospora gaudefroyi TaxID=184978 RepID=A0A6A5KW87_9PLEO|nr:hypothetical protein BDW02DRAFT_594235 [Decorospora gaudefroyi]
MHPTHPLTISLCVIALSLTSPASSRQGRTENDAITSRTCSPDCYSAYRHLMGESLSHMAWIQQSFSHKKTANDLCAVEQCSTCPFCTLSPSPTLSFQTDTKAQAKVKTDDEVMISCMDCQTHLEDCTQPAGGEPPPTHQAILTGELALCHSSGPLHCRTGGPCERRICKDLFPPDLSTQQQPQQCKDCVKAWIACIHDVCLAPTHDGYADRPESLNCYEGGDGGAQCAQSSWQDLNTRPTASCMARCWAVHTGALPCRSGLCSPVIRLSQWARR